MDRPTVVVTEPIHPAGIRLLEEAGGRAKELGRELVERYHGANTSIKGLWIRQFLLENPRTSITDTLNAWKRFCEDAEIWGVNNRVGSYNSMYPYLYRLRRLGLVVRERIPHPTKPSESVVTLSYQSPLA